MTVDSQPDVIRNEYPLYLLLGISLIAMGFSSETWGLVFPLLIGVGLHSSCSKYFRPRLGLIGYLVASLPFAILSNVYEIEGRDPAANQTTLFYIALYMEMVGLLRLYRDHDRNRLPIIVACSGIGMVSAGATLTERDSHIAFAIMTLIYAMTMLLSVRTSLRIRGRGGRRWVAIAGIIAIYTTFLGVWVSHTYYHTLNQMVARLVLNLPLSSTVGFKKESKLRSISDLRNSSALQTVAIRAFAKEEPGYLRAKVYITYSSGIWSTGFKGHEKQPDFGENRKKSVGRIVIPGRREPGEFEEVPLHIYPASGYDAHFFLPLKTSAVDTASRMTVFFPGNAMMSKHTSTTRGYGVIQGFLPVFDVDSKDTNFPVANQDEAPSPLYTGLPPGGELAPILQKIVAGFVPGKPGESDAERFRRAFVRCQAEPAFAEKMIGNYLSTYTYRIGIELTNEESPMVGWLSRRGKDRYGHCELFATAGTLLLRKAGVPARYVTGFVCAEKNSYADLWVARTKHAHAWCEFFTRDGGWQKAEFTPPDGRPETEPSDTDAFLEYLKAEWERIKGFFMREGFAGVLGLLGRAGYVLIATWPRRIALGLAIAGYLLVRMLRNRRRAEKRRNSQRVLPENIAALQKAYILIEKELARKELGKRDSETLDEYICRLSEEELEGKQRIIGVISALAEKRYAPF